MIKTKLFEFTNFINKQWTVNLKSPFKQFDKIMSRKQNICCCIECWSILLLDVDRDCNS